MKALPLLAAMLAAAPASAHDGLYPHVHELNAGTLGLAALLVAGGVIAFRFGRRT
ncbi:hypothetical protein Ga0609869_001544 [Rhodovulum iodosum]|uniref:LPXTG cell wall anchor domain-containing protein n=1 Tax=Rhodovulum iodosum TaxID=68291 RepID=A0ABV3XS85_9RHOB|nr:hypothetical protein [Rhodovulum robiginosum]